MTLKVTTRLTLEDVTVTDNAGKPVHGLKQSDFTVLEDGKPQPLRNFQEYGTEIPSTQPARVLPPNTYSNIQPPSPTTSALNIFLLDELTTGLVNHLQMAPANLSYARQASTSYLRKMPSGTRVAILMSGAYLQVLQPVTTDRDVLLGTIDAMKYQSVPRSYLPVAGNGCDAANMQSRLTLQNLSQMLAYLAGTPGRKNVIWFTPGIPWLTNYTRFAAVQCGLVDFTVELQKLYDALTAAHIVLYPVDPRGLKTGMPDMSLPAAPPGFMSTFSGTIFEEHGSQRDLAEATGGIAAYDRNDLDAAVGEAIATGSDFYSLAYVPPSPGYDGKFHKIEVKVDRPGLHLQYRKGYASIDPNAPVKPDKNAPKSADKNGVPDPSTPDAQMHAAMAHGVSTSTQMLFDLRIARAQTPAPPSAPVLGLPNPILKGKPLVRYDLQFSIPPDQITLAEEPGGARRAAVELVLVAYDEQGRMLNVLSQNAVLPLKPENVATFLQRPFQLPLQFDLPPGKIFVRAGILDLASNKIGTLELPETVPKP